MLLVVVKLSLNQIAEGDDATLGVDGLASPGLCRCATQNIGGGAA